jgi:hypothetical protein
LLELIRCRAGESADFLVDARAMPRVVSIYLPSWSIDRMMRAMGAGAPDRTKPLVLVGLHGRQRVVTAANPVAAGLGLRSGMPATRAQALVPDLVIHHADPDADAKALDRLAVRALRYSPVVAVDPPDGIVLDTLGADHLHGGEDVMASDVGRRLRQAGPRPESLSRTHGEHLTHWRASSPVLRSWCRPVRRPRRRTAADHRCGSQPTSSPATTKYGFRRIVSTAQGAAAPAGGDRTKKIANSPRELAHLF